MAWNPFARVFSRKKGVDASQATIARRPDSTVGPQPDQGAYGADTNYSDFDARQSNVGGYSQQDDVSRRPMPEMPELKDPTRLNSEIGPSDLVHPDPPDFTALLESHDLNEPMAVNYVLEQHRIAAERRYLLEREWALNIAFYEGRQWYRLDDNTARLMSMINDEEPVRYITINLVAYLTDKLVSLATMTEPDAQPVALTKARIDQMATREVRAIMGYTSRKFDRPRQVSSVAKWAILTGTGIRKCVWNPTAEALVPKGIHLTQNPQTGEPELGLTGSQLAPVGDVDEHVVPPFEFFPDPSARQWEEIRWAVHAKVRPLTYVQEIYPTRGFDVSADVFGAGSHRSWVDTYLSSGGATSTGFAAPSPTQAASGRSGAGTPQTVVVYEYWELPSPRFPDGRLIIIAGRKLLHYGPWPYDKRDEIPFVPTFYRRASDSPFGLGIVRDAIPVQMAYNRIASSLVEQMEAQFDYALLEAGSDVDIQEFLQGVKRTVRRVPVKRGMAPPQIVRSPGLSMDRFQLLQQFYERLQDIFGVHDISKGGAPQGVTAGISIDLLQQSDQSQLKPFTTEIEWSAVQLYGWEVPFFKQFYSVPRLMGLDESGNPEEALMSVQTFSGLTQGGQTRVIVTPGSAMPKTPAGKRQEILELYQLGIFGPPGTPDAARTVVQLLDLAGSDIILDALNRIEQKMEMAAQQEAQQQAQIAQAQEQAKSQAAIAGQQAKAQTDMQLGQMKAANDLQLGQQKATMDAQNKFQIGMAGVQADLEGKQGETEREMQLNEHQAGLDVMIEREKARIEVLKEKALRDLGLTPDPMQMEAVKADNQYQIAGLKAKQMAQTAASKPSSNGKSTTKKG